jgi:hypothetical protein
MAKTSVLMEPFVDHLQGAPFLIAPEKNGRLAGLVFHGERWTFEAYEGSPASDVQHFGSDPAENHVWVTYAGRASVWCVSYYAATLLRVISGKTGKFDGVIDLGRELGYPRCR